MSRGGIAKKAGFAAFLHIHHEESESSGGNDGSGIIGQRDLDGRQTAAHLFGGGFAEDLLAGCRAEKLHGAVGGDAVATFGAGTAAGSGIGQSGQQTAMDDAVGVITVLGDGKFPADQTGLGVGDHDAALIRELVRAVDLGGNTFGNGRKRHGKNSLFFGYWREV